MNEAFINKERSHSISGAFVFYLLGVFAVFATLVILLGAQFYRNVVEQTDINSEQRILTNYIINTVRGNDAMGGVAIRKIDDIDVLSFVWNAGDDSYETLIYCYDGYLREYFGDIDMDFEPSYGEIICRAQDFALELYGQLLNVEITGSTGEVYEMYLALRCDSGVVE